MSITKNCGTLIKQTYTRAQETLEFKLTQPRETFHSKPPISIEGSWMIGLTSLDVYNSIFNITEKNKKFELLTDIFDELSFTKLKDELEAIYNVSKSSDDLKNDLKGRVIIIRYR